LPFLWRTKVELVAWIVVGFSASRTPSTPSTHLMLSDPTVESRLFPGAVLWNLVVSHSFARAVFVHPKCCAACAVLAHRSLGTDSAVVPLGRAWRFVLLSLPSAVQKTIIAFLT
jgi:hypothetical protein